MSDALPVFGVIMAAIVTTSGAIIGILLRSLLQRVERVQHEVTANGGDSAYDRLIGRVDGVASDMRGVRRDIGRLHDADTRISEMVREQIEAAVERHEQRHHKGG